MAKVIKAVAGVLVKDKQVFMATRPEGKVYAGSWEFPGGKIEVGESATHALIRELKEEIGIITTVTDCSKLTYITQSYEHGDIQLEVFLVKDWQGEVMAMEGQKIHWQNIEELCVQEPLLITTKKILDILSGHCQRM